MLLKRGDLRLVYNFVVLKGKKERNNDNIRWGNNMT